MTASHDRPITYIVLTYKTKYADIAPLIASLSQQQVVIVDNTPPTERRLRRTDFPVSAVFLPQNRNLGYAGGVNVGLSYAFTHHAYWAVILNEDITCDISDFASCTRRLSSLQDGLAGPRFGTFDRNRWSTILTGDRVINATPAPKYVSGSFLAIHRRVYDRIGPIPEPYFIYYEDAEYSVRATQAGFSLNELELPSFKHPESTSPWQKRFLHEYYLARNHLLFVERNAPLPVRAHELIRLPKTIHEHFRRRNHGGTRGIVDYLVRRFGEYAGRDVA